MSDFLHQFIICVLDNIPHLVLDGRTGKFVMAHEIPHVECYSKYEAPDWPVLKLQQDVFGHEHLVSSIGHVVHPEDESLNEELAANEEEWDSMIRQKSLDEVARELNESEDDCQICGGLGCKGMCLE